MCEWLSLFIQFINAYDQLKIGRQQLRPEYIDIYSTTIITSSRFRLKKRENPFSQALIIKAFRATHAIWHYYFLK
ncbi:hypothetical protein TSH100_00405 [Azospirillum sp. TSH100]|nr:hypothetical protein TSH100_00405 [Azospirillum sp. TSH100]